MPHTQLKPLAGKAKVIVTRHLLPAIEARMGELFDVQLNTEDTPMSRDDLIAAMQDCDVLVPTVTDRLDGEMIAQAGERLGLIANFGAGTDHIDLAAARENGIVVANTPGVFTDDTADLTMGLIIGVPRRMRDGTALIRRGEWTGWSPVSMLGTQLGGKVLGIVGMGRIGQAVAHRARAFGLQIAYHNRRPLPGAIENMFHARYVADLDELLGMSDIVSLHCPSTPETRNLIDSGRFAAMKPGASLINTARGDIVDYDALMEALDSGHLSGAGLDVYPDEPYVDPRLLAHRNTITQPHTGSATVEGREHAGEKVIANIVIWASGERPPDMVLDGLV